jgi:hypothetical protein
MRVAELQRLLEDVPPDAEVVVDHTPRWLRKTGEHRAKVEVVMGMDRYESGSGFRVVDIETCTRVVFR